ncbi:uncharacterized protein FOBCDRAFT_242058 [Fusarium oxysporum Fo47]|uniref:uncharacterized protein n=1 Tax=Fusarium oxysporum Fo47 TaxID=660027 RepID=UPI00286992E0|nr:uncharacterized protein FOBCDRAFT_242058 [Fusarium oxysporum Fo47]QKD57590.2 hypothetical protein FOBCDRAFT_242058 [Fusarium oxysporum Fo47]
MKALDWDLNVSELQFSLLKASFEETVDPRSRICSLIRSSYDPPTLRRADAKAGDEFSQHLIESASEQETLDRSCQTGFLFTVIESHLASDVYRSGEEERITHLIYNTQVRREATPNTTQHPPDFDRNASLNTELYETSHSGDWENEVDIIGVSYVDDPNSRKLVVTIMSRSTNKEETLDMELIYKKCPQKVRYSYL